MAELRKGKGNGKSAISVTARRKGEVNFKTSNSLGEQGQPSYAEAVKGGNREGLWFSKKKEV